MSTTKDERCANGKTGYDVESGKAYTPKPACSQPARPGHIYCDACRRATGGYVP